MLHIAVLIPCYNEEQTIGKVIKDFKTALPDIGTAVFVFDNNSTDNTVSEARKAGAVIYYETRQGKGNVLRRMFSFVDADIYLLVDGDDTYPADDAMELIAAVEHGADMAIGDRLSTTYHSENSRPFHSFGNNLICNAVNAITGAEVKDVLSGYRAFSFRFAKTLPILTEGFDVETEITMFALDKRLKVVSIPINYKNRPEGSESKLTTFKDGAKILKQLGALFKDFRPLLFWGVIALVLMAVAFIFFLPIFINFLSTGEVEKIPTLIVSGFTFLAGINSLFTGFILQSLRRNELSRYEQKLIDWEWRREHA